MIEPRENPKTPRADRFDPLECVKDMTLTLASADSEDEIYQLITMKVVSRFGIRRCRIFLLSYDGLSLLQVASHCGCSTEDKPLRDATFMYVGDDIVGACALSGRSHLVGDTRLFGESIDDGNDGQAKLSVPILLDQDVHAVIDCEHPYPGFFTTEHLRILECVASAIAAILRKPASPGPETSSGAPGRLATVVKLADYKDS